MSSRLLGVLLAVLALAVGLGSPHLASIAQAQVVIVGPTSLPTTQPTTAPTTVPTTYPTTYPTTIPAYIEAVPTTAPTTVPTTAPTTMPTTYPTTAPTTAPTTVPTTVPTVMPTSYPTVIPGTPPPATTAMTHLITFAYYPPTASCATWSKYLDYVYPQHSADFGTLHTCGVKTIAYVSPSMPQNTEYDLSISWGSTSATQSPAPSPGPYYSVLAKSSTGTLVTTYGGTGYLMDPHASSAPAYYQAVVNQAQKVSPDLIFSDNSDEIYGVSATPNDWSGQNDWATSTKGVLDQITGVAPLILNTLGLPTAYSQPPADDTITNILIPVTSPSVAGAMLENTYWGNRNASGYHDALGNPSGAWVSQEDMEITTINAGKIFQTLANGSFTTYEKTNGPGSALGIQARLYVLASTLLSGDPKLVMIGEEMQQPSGVDAYPEMLLVPLNPVQTAKTTINELRVGTNTLYKREFSTCYYQGSLVGPCAVVVNMSNSATVSVSLPQYSHSFVLSGTDLLDGGKASFLGPQVTQLGANSAAVLFP